MTEHQLQPNSDDEKEIDAILRSTPPPLSEGVTERVSSFVMRRLEHRRRRLRGARRLALLLAAAAVLVAALSLVPRPVSVAPEVTDPSGSSPDGEEPRGAIPEARRESEQAAQQLVEKAVRARKELDELRTGGPEVVVQLVETAESGDTEHARRAAELLVELGTPLADEAILAQLAGAPDSRLSRWLLGTVCRRITSGRRLLPRVFEIDGVHRQLLVSLARSRASVFRFVIEEVLDSDSPIPRARAWQALAGRSPSQAANRFWLECSRCAQAEMGAPGTRGLDSFLATALDGLPGRALRDLLDDVRGGMLRPSRLGRTNRPRAPAWEDRVILALGRCGARAAWPLLAAALETHGPDPVAIRATGQLGDARALPRLKRWLYLSDERGEAAVEAIGRLPGKEALRLLLSVHAEVLSTSPELWPGLEDSLTKALLRRESEVLDLLRTACRSEARQQKAIASLVALFPERAGPELSRLLSDTPRNAQTQIVDALARLRSPPAIRALLDALEDPALHRSARRSLRRIARRDLGSRPQAWRRWFQSCLEGEGKRTSSGTLDGRTLLLSIEELQWKEAS